MHRWHCILSLCTAATLLSNNIIATNGYCVFFLLVVVVVIIFFPLSYGSITWREKKNINVRKFKTAEWQQQKINVQ